MKKTIYLLATVFIFGFASAQTDSDFNEPPTRSEFEQVKSKIQVYERKLNQISGRMNSFNAEINESMTGLDSMIQYELMQMGNRKNDEAIYTELKSQFLTDKDLKSFKDDMMKEVDSKLADKENQEYESNVLLFIYVLSGLFVVLLILIIMLWSSMSKRMKKLNADIDKKMEEINAMNEQLKRDFENTKIRLQSDLKDELKNTEDAIMAKVQSNKALADVEFKDMKKSFDKRINDLNKKIEEAFISADKKNGDKITKVQKRMDEVLGEQVKKSEGEIKTLTDKIVALKKELDSVKPKKK